ncbi:MAG: ribonuclease BN [Crocinitomicaceae bacterium]|nr:ribonuclease BN [Crocinitomicaceae bacterium]
MIDFIHHTGLRKLKYKFLRLLAFSKTISIPGFNKLPLFYVLRFFLKSLINGDILNKAGSMAFSFFLALFPALIFIFSLIPYVPIKNFQENLMLNIELILPGPAYEFTQSTISELVLNSRFDLLSFGFIAMLFFASNGVNTTIDNFNNSILVEKKRSWLSQRFTAFWMVALLGSLVIVSMFMLFFGKTVLQFLASQELMSWAIAKLLTYLNYIIVVAFIYFTVSFFYYFGPSKKSRWKFFSAGSSLATLFIILVSFAFQHYIDAFNTYNKFYGSLGAIMVIMLWFYFNCVIFLIGFELNTALKRVHNDVKRFIHMRRVS